MNEHASSIIGTKMELSKRFVQVDINKVPMEVWNGAPNIWKDVWKWYLMIEKEEDWQSNEIIYSNNAKDYWVVKRNVDCYYHLAIKTIPYYFVREGKEVGVRVAGKDIPKYWDELEVVKNHIYWLIDLENMKEWYCECFARRKKAKLQDADEIF